MYLVNLVDNISAKIIDVVYAINYNAQTYG